MAERVFARKLERVGFVDVWISERTPFGVDRVSRYPLFTPEVIELMRELIPAERQSSVAVSVIAKGKKQAPPNV